MTFRWIVALALLLSTAGPVAAQQRLFVAMYREVVELDPRPVSLGTVLRRFPLPDEAGLPGPDAAAFGGGEFLAWVGVSTPGPRIVLLNTLTGAVQAIAVPDFFPTRVLGGDGVSRLVVLGSTPSAGRGLLVANARSKEWHVVDIGPAPLSFTDPIAYAAGADLLFSARARTSLPDSLHDVDVRHAESGALLRTLDIAPVSADVVSVNDDGTRMYVTDALNGTFVYDVASGRRIAANTSEYVLQSALRTPALDESRNRLIVNIEPSLTGFGEGIGISAFTADSLQLLGRVRVPELPVPQPSSTIATGLTQEIDVNGLSATIFVLQAATSRTKYGPVSCHASQLIALDATTGGVRQTVGTTTALGDGACLANLVRVTEPLPTRAGAVEVAGRRVALKWQAPFGATRYEVEVGSAPGLTDLATIRVAEPSLVVDAVPPGVYYVRVRAGNTIGRSRPSGEIRIVVQ
jgi:hypothetical protein